MPNDQGCAPCKREGLNAHTLKLHIAGKKHREMVGMEAPLVEEAHDQECQICDLSGLTANTLVIHEATERHAESLLINVPVDERVYPEDLQAAIDGYELDPRDRAKMIRGAFAARDWPDDSHPGSVKDFMVENHIPFFYLPPHVTWADGKNYSNAAAKQIMKTGAFNPDKE